MARIMEIEIYPWSIFMTKKVYLQSLKKNTRKTGMSHTAISTKLIPYYFLVSPDNLQREDFIMNLIVLFTALLFPLWCDCIIFPCPCINFALISGDRKNKNCGWLSIVKRTSFCIFYHVKFALLVLVQHSRILQQGNDFPFIRKTGVYM